MKVIIIDDEENSREVLRVLLNKFCPEFEILGEAYNINSAYELIVEKKPEIVFLDIQMPGGSGFDLLKKFTSISFEIVFITSYDQYAIEAIKCSALDYLLKPIEVDELKKTALRISEAIHKKSTQQLQFINVIDYVEDRELEKKIIVHHQDKVLLLSISKITHLEGEGNYTLIHTSDQGRYTSSKNLGEFEDMLENYSIFFRISKSCIANLNYISDYSKGEPCIIHINGEHNMEISRRKKQEFLERIRQA
jgi:two-component system LytT family response regulator